MLKIRYLPTILLLSHHDTIFHIQRNVRHIMLKSLHDYFFIEGINYNQQIISSENII